MLKRVCRLPPRRSTLLLGPRQTGKSTLVRSLLPRGSWSGTHNGAEVDLLVERHGRLRLGEVDVLPYRSFFDRLPRLIR